MHFEKKKVIILNSRTKGLQRYLYSTCLCFFGLRFPAQLKKYDSLLFDIWLYIIYCSIFSEFFMYFFVIRMSIWFILTRYLLGGNTRYKWWKIIFFPRLLGWMEKKWWKIGAHVLGSAQIERKTKLMPASAYALVLAAVVVALTARKRPCPRCRRPHGLPALSS